MSGSRTTTRLVIFATLILAVLSGCTAEPTATPALVDPTGFVSYIHPSGAFSLSMPPDWIVNDDSTDFALSVDFSPPNVSDPLVSVYVLSADIYAGAPAPPPDTIPDNPQLAAGIDALQSTFYNQNNIALREHAREFQPDGSLRIKFILESPQGTSQHNDFVQIVDPYFIALRIRIPDDLAQFRTVTRILDTFSVDTASAWRSTVVEASALGGGQSAVGFSSLNAWADRNGGFVIVGQVVNNADQALEFVRISAQLFDDSSNLLATQDDFVSSDMILPGEFTPFSIVFSDGLPGGTVRYDLNASARFANFAERNFYGPENFAWSSESAFNENGFLEIKGQVRNEGDLTANLVKVIVTIFDEDQRVIGTDTTLVDNQRLAPGEASPFSVVFVELGGTPNTFLVSAQGVVEE